MSNYYENIDKKENKDASKNNDSEHKDITKSPLSNQTNRSKYKNN